MVKGMLENPDGAAAAWVDVMNDWVVANAGGGGASRLMAEELRRAERRSTAHKYKGQSLQTCLSINHTTGSARSPELRQRGVLGP
jgi:hypothetical protein